MIYAYQRCSMVLVIFWSTKNIVSLVLFSSASPKGFAISVNTGIEYMVSFRGKTYNKFGTPPSEDIGPGYRTRIGQLVGRQLL